MPDGSIPAITELEISFASEEASYRNVLGWYNKRTGEAGVLFADTNDDGASAGIAPRDTARISALQSDIDSGDFGFFLIPDGAAKIARLGGADAAIRFELDRAGKGEIVYDTPRGQHELWGAGGQILFSDPALNFRGRDYMSGQVGTDGQSTAAKFGPQSDGADGILGLMAWDDQIPHAGNTGSDRDFNDAVFIVTVVPPPNAAPTGITLSNASVPENETGATVGILTTVDPDAGDTHTYTVSDPRFEILGNALVLKQTESLDYESEATVRVTVTTTDQDGLSYSQDFDIAVRDIDEGSAGGDVSGAVEENANMPATGQVVFPDPDGDGNTTVAALGYGRYGLWQIDSAGSWSYTLSDANPAVQALNAGDFLEDQFTVWSSFESLSLTIRIVISGTNDAPVANVADFSTEPDMPLSGALLATDPDNAALTYALEGPAPEGLVLNPDGTFTYTPPAGFAGLVSFSYTARDETLTSAPATVTITVIGDNSAPTGIELSNHWVLDNQVGAWIGLLTAVDPDTGDVHTFTVSDPRFEIVGNQLVLKQGQYLDYETEQEVVVSVTATDQNGLSVTQDLSLFVLDVYEGYPGDDGGPAEEDSPYSTTGQLYLPDPDGDGKTTVPANNYTKFGYYYVDSGGSWEYILNNANPIVQALNRGDFLNDEFTVEGGRGAYNVTIGIVISGNNDAPIVEVSSFSTPTDSPLSGRLAVLDPDSDVHSFELVGPAPDGLVLNADGAFTYTPPAGFSGLVTFSYLARDEALSSAPATITLKVGVDNAVPDISGKYADSVIEDDYYSYLAGYTYAAGTVLFTDADPDESGATAASGQSAYGTWAIDGSGAWCYVLDREDPAVQALALGDTLQDTFEVQSKDHSAAQIITITINGSNDYPAFGGTFKGDVREDDPTPATGTVFYKDADANQDGATPASGQTDYGSWNVDAAGNWSYALLDSSDPRLQTLGAGSSFIDQFDIHSKDGSMPRAVQVTIHGVNDVPTDVSGDFSGTVVEDSGAPATGKITFADVDTGESGLMPGSGASAYGSWSTDKDGTWTYSLDNGNAAVQALPAGESLTDSWTALSADGTANAVVQITIQGADEPLAAGPSGTEINPADVLDATNADSASIVSGSSHDPVSFPAADATSSGYGGGGAVPLLDQELLQIPA
jgi:VCBS repeat-containing protein